MRTRTKWEEFFDGHAPVYNENCFTRNTVAEVEFLIEALRLAPGASVLDVGCGTGRHAIELARHGYRVTGVDLSAGMLEEARKGADVAGVEVAWRQCDATVFVADHPFDGVVCLCEGAFGLLEQADQAIDQPLAILRTVAHAMKPSAKCLFTVLNGMAMIRRHTQADVEPMTFDPLTLTEVSECNPAVSSTTVPLCERGFLPTELTLLFRAAGLETLHIWGGTAGNWGRRKLELDEMEIMVLATRH